MRPGANGKAWRVVLGALVVLALIGAPAGLVGAKQKPQSEETTESSAPESSEGEADAGGSTETTAEDESATEDEPATEADASGEESESGPAESTGAGESTQSNRQARTSQGGPEQPEAECPEGTEFLVKFEWNGTAFVPEGGDPKGVTITDVVLDEEGEPTSASFTSEVEIAVVAVKTGGGTTFVTINGTSGTVSSPDVHAISHLTFCVPAEAPPPPPPGDITVDLVKDNDADEDGTFTDSEEASEEGQDVTFQVVITNTSDVAVMIMSLTDAFGERVIDPLECLTAEGNNVIRMWLDPDESVTCTFTVQNYAPPAGASLVDTVEVTVCEKGSDDRVSDSDTSEVTTPEEAPPPPADITVDVVKDNDADENGSFSDSEEASEEGQDVTFQVVITNTSEVAVEILSLSDAFDEFVFDPIACLTSGGENVIGMVLDPDESVTCTFTILNYSPSSEESLVDTVEVTVGEEGNEENRASDSDTSVVTTVEVLGGIVTPPRPGAQPPAQPGAQVAEAGALAVTGVQLALMGLLAAGLLIAGAALIYSARGRSRQQQA